MNDRTSGTGSGGFGQGAGRGGPRVPSIYGPPQTPLVTRSGLALACFILAIVGIIFPPLAVIAFILGFVSLIRIEASGGRLTGRAFAIVGIVLPVFTILAYGALLLPALTRVREQARSVACRANLHQWGLVFVMYTSDCDGRFMEGPLDPNGSNGWVKALGPYYEWDTDLTCCPNATQPWQNESGMVWAAADGRDSLGMAWGYDQLQGWPQPMKGSYGINGWCYDPKSEQGHRGKPEKCYWRTPNVRSANSIPVFLGSQRLDGRPEDTDAPPELPRQQQYGPQTMEYVCLDRHRGFNNCLFLDWSVREVGLKELWMLKWHRDYNTSGPWTRAGGVEPEDWPTWMRKFKDY